MKGKKKKKEVIKIMTTTETENRKVILQNGALRMVT